MNNVKVGTHGEIIIMKKLREKYGIKPGQNVIEYDAGDHIAIVPVSNNPIENLCGKYSWEESIQELKEKAEELALKEVEKRK